MRTSNPKRFPLVIRRVAATLALALAAQGAAGSPESEFSAVRDAAQRGHFKVVEAARARFAGHPLEPYPHYWLLAAQLERADPAEIRAFLTRFADSPLAEALRRDWLRTLGAARSWELFRAEQPRLLGDDAEVLCYSFQERMARSDPEVAAEARAVFIASREAPAPCDPVFAALAAAGVIAEEDIASRARRLLAENLLRDAKRALALIPARSRINEKLLDQAAADPARFLTRHLKSAVLTRNDRELAVFALVKLARSKPEEAAERLGQAAGRLGTGPARFAWSYVALHGAMAHHPQALEWFAQAGDAPLTGTQVAWRARAALRAAAWKDVFAAIQQLAPEQARESTWRYWRARALAQLGEAEASQGLLRSLAAERNFYGLLAAEELGADVVPDWNGWKPQAEDLERVGAHPGVQRALALYRIGFDVEALREWAWATRRMDDRDLLAAAELARQAGKSERAINTANRTVQLHDLAQRYPTPHRDAVGAAARQWGLDEALVFSIIRQESRFVAEARSRVGAMGLMQLMPATASWVARQIPVQPFRAQMLAQPELNVRMGSYYFGRVLGDLGHPVLAAAAYNAGPGRARRWRDERALEGAIYIETIPFNETRDYVKQVFANAWFYRHRLTGQLASLRQLVGMVPGRNGEGPQASLASHLP